MKSSLRFLLLVKVIFIALVQSYSLSVSANPRLEKISKIAESSVVKLWGAGSSGSGVVVELPKEDGTGFKKLIFTAYHVVSKLGENESFEIELANGEFIEIP